MKSHHEYIGQTHIPALYADLLEVLEHQHERRLPPYVPPGISRQHYGDETVVSVAAEPYDNGRPSWRLTRIAEIPLRASVTLMDLKEPFTDEAYTEAVQSGASLVSPESGKAASTIEIYSEPKGGRGAEFIVDLYAGTGDLAVLDPKGIERHDLSVLAETIRAYRPDLINDSGTEKVRAQYGGRASQLALQSLNHLFGKSLDTMPPARRRKAGIETLVHADVPGVVKYSDGYRVEDPAEYDSINPVKVTYIPLKHLRRQMPGAVDALGVQSDLVVAHSLAVTYEGREVGFSGTTISYQEAAASGGRDTMVSMQRMPDGIVVARRYDLNQAVLDTTNGPDELVVRPTPADMPSRYLPADEANALRYLGVATRYPMPGSLLAIGRAIKGICSYPQELEAHLAKSEQRRFQQGRSGVLSGGVYLRR